jgi:hypothetical protein
MSKQLTFMLAHGETSNKNFLFLIHILFLKLFGYQYIAILKFNQTTH